MRRSPVTSLFISIGFIFFGPSLPAHPQVITDTSDGTLTAVVPFGTMNVGDPSAPVVQQLQFRLRCKDLQGYRLLASASLSNSSSAPDEGGQKLGASDIGVGITAIDLSAAFVIKPRTDQITSGFDYDPSTITPANGLTPYPGAAAGQATLADLAAGGVEILSGPKIANNENFQTANFLTVTVTLGAFPQFFTPGTATAIVTLTIVDGP